MARTTPEPVPELYRCILSFAVFVDGIPQVYAAGTEVLGDDPILKTHGSYFEPAAARLVRRPRVEDATAEPGAAPRRVVSTPKSEQGLSDNG